MKLITWNCQGALRKKFDVILSYEPDIVVIQECEHTDKINFNALKQIPNAFHWYGDNVHKGLGIYSFSDYQFEILPEFNPKFRYVVPFQVKGCGQSFTLFAIWAMDNKENRNARYIGQVWFALMHYATLLDESSILIGDFNSNKIWDHKDRVGSHSDVVSKLAEKNIQSLYHQHHKAEQGKEQHPTFFLQRNLNKPYHLDYCFASSDFADKVSNVEIGSYENWIAHSDHSPLIITFDL